MLVLQLRQFQYFHGSLAAVLAQQLAADYINIGKMLQGKILRIPM